MAEWSRRDEAEMSTKPVRDVGDQPKPVRTFGRPVQRCWSGGTRGFLDKSSCVPCKYHCRCPTATARIHSESCDKAATRTFPRKIKTTSPRIWSASSCMVPRTYNDV